jgi:hypothetical protein
MNPVSARLLDFVFTAGFAQLERTALFAEIGRKRDEGLSDDEITDHLQQMTWASEADAQAKIDAARRAMES